MSLILSEPPASAPLTEADIHLARQSFARLASVLNGSLDTATVLVGQSEEAVPLPPAAVRVLANALQGMAEGSPFLFVDPHSDLTLSQAADLLNVSRGYVERLVAEGHLKLVAEASQPRINLRELLEFKTRDLEVRRRIADQLTAEAQELGMY